MFTGIIEARGRVADIQDRDTNRHIYIESSFTPELGIVQSIAHNGVCMTVVSIKDLTYEVAAIQESLSKTTLDELQIGDLVNLERCVSANSLMDGHIVQGHVDETLTCIEKRDENGSWNFRFKMPVESANLIVPRGSICINGVSLTVASIDEDSFEVAIIPYTYEHAGFDSINNGDSVNVEYDIIGKYIKRYQELKEN